MLKTLSGRSASQDADELHRFIDLLKRKNVRRYLEIGARHGDTLYEIGMALPEGSVLVGVDLPGGNWGTSKSKVYLEAAAEALRRAGRTAHLIFGNSRAAGTEGMIVRRGPYDAILIDGDHLYEGVRSDWLKYGDLAPIVAFHDIAGHGVVQKDSGLPVEVPRLWQELKDEGHVFSEFVSPGSKMGIGVILQ